MNTVTKRLLGIFVGILLVSLGLGRGLAQADLKDGLVAYYPFNGNANDESGNGNNGTVNGATLTADRNGNANSAYSFDGTDDYIDTIYKETNLKKCTFSVWIKNSMSTEFSLLLQNRGALYSEGRSISMTIYRIHLNSDFVSIGKGTNKQTNDNKWHNIIGIWDGQEGSLIRPDQFKFYVDGVLSIENTFDYDPHDKNVKSPITGNGTFKIGFSEADNTYFSGKIDDIRIYNRVLTDSEIQQLYSGVSPSVIVKPYTFTSGTPAKAAEVNADFDTLYQQMNALKASFCQEHPTASACQ